MGRAEKREQGEVGLEARVPGKGRVATPLAICPMQKKLVPVRCLLPQQVSTTHATQEVMGLIDEVWPTSQGEVGPSILKRQSIQLDAIMDKFKPKIRGRGGRHPNVHVHVVRPPQQPPQQDVGGAAGRFRAALLPAKQVQVADRERSHVAGLDTAPPAQPSGDEPPAGGAATGGISRS